MVELLAVIVILGILAVIGIASVRGVLGRSKSSYLDSQNKMAVLAGKAYYSDYRSKLPKVMGPVSSVSLQRLIDLKYIDPIKDADGNLCVLGDNSKVYVQKVDNEEYKYWAFLSCNGKTSGEHESNSPTVLLTPQNTNGTSEAPVSVLLTAKDDTKVLSYRYIIYKDGHEYKSVSKLYKKPVSIRLTETGEYTIQAYVYDVFGNQGKTRGGVYSLKIADPDCSTFKVNDVPNADNWQNKNITFTVSSSSFTIARWTLEDKYTDTATGSMKNKNLIKKTSSSKKSFTLKDNGTHEIIIKGYNSEGKSCERSLTTYKIDKERPSLPTLTGNPGKWTNQNFKLTGTTVDKYSGVSHWEYSYDQKNWTEYIDSEKDTFVTSEFSETSNQDIYLRAVDKAGNTSSVAKSTIQIDKTSPTCSSSAINSGLFKYITGTCSDTGGSGCKDWLVMTTFSATGSYSPGTVYDNAGNSTVCPAVSVTVTSTTPVEPEKPKDDPKPTKKVSVSKSDIVRWQRATTRKDCSDAQVQCKTMCKSFDTNKDKGICANKYCTNANPKKRKLETGNYLKIYNESDGCFKKGEYVANVVGRMLASVDGSTLTLDLYIAQGTATYMQNSYYLDLIIQKEGAKDPYKTIPLKNKTNDDWNGGHIYDNSKVFSHKFTCDEAGTYTVKTVGNTSDPGFGMNFGSFTVSCS